MDASERRAIAIEQSREDAKRCTERFDMPPEDHRQLLLEAWSFGLQTGMIRPVA